MLLLPFKNMSFQNTMVSSEIKTAGKEYQQMPAKKA